MVRMTMAIAMVLGLTGAVLAQEGERKGEKEKKKEGRDSIGLNDLDTNRDGRAQVSELQAAIARLTGSKESGDKKKERGEEGSVPLKDVDTNSDGRASLPELQAALAKAREGGEKEGGKKEEGGKRK